MQLADTMCSRDGRERNLAPRVKHWCPTYPRKGHNMRNHQIVLAQSSLRNNIGKHMLFRYNFGLYMHLNHGGT
jgi:hypothetical protein